MRKENVKENYKSLTSNNIGPYRAFNAPLYPGLQISGMTNGAKGLPPALVIPVLAVRTNAGYSAGYKSGFTLIELLVVVLIIGILASVALPQYQKAVEKSRAAQALTLLKSVAQAAETYYLANGTEFTSFDELPVEIPWPISNRVVGDDSNQTETLANGQWALEVEHSSLGSSTLFMIRLDGKYKGAGFVVQLRNSTEGHFGTTEIKCYERKSISTVIFDSSLPEGAYCVQIMKGTLALDTQWSRSYRLP